MSADTEHASECIGELVCPDVTDIAQSHVEKASFVLTTPDCETNIRLGCGVLPGSPAICKIVV